MAGYNTDLSNKEWQLIQPFFPRAKKRGAKIKHSMRDSVNAIYYVLRSGCAWSLLPNDFPPKSTVYGRYRDWIDNGLWAKIHDKLRSDLRKKLGRNEEPSAAIVDSQSVKTTDQSCEKGYDGGKRIKGRKRHLMVDVLGLLICVLVTPASVGDRKGAEKNFEKAFAKFPGIKKIWADGSYSGPIVDFVKSTYNSVLEVIKPIKDKGPGFHVRPWCWIVERTFGWLNKQRRLSKDYEVLESTSEALIQIGMIRIMLRRLANS